MIYLCGSLITAGSTMLEGLWTLEFPAAPLNCAPLTMNYRALRNTSTARSSSTSVL